MQIQALAQKSRFYSAAWFSWALLALSQASSLLCKSAFSAGPWSRAGLLSLFLALSVVFAITVQVGDVSKSWIFKFPIESREFRGTQCPCLRQEPPSCPWERDLAPCFGTRQGLSYLLAAGSLWRWFQAPHVRGKLRRKRDLRRKEILLA